MPKKVVRNLLQRLLDTPLETRASKRAAKSPKDTKKNSKDPTRNATALKDIPARVADRYFQAERDGQEGRDTNEPKS